MRTLFRAILVAAALGSAAMASAQTDDFNGFVQITRGDYRSAEQLIERQRRLFPDDPDLTLNLATIYVNTGRRQQAIALYQAILARPDQELMLRDNVSASSHRLARLGMARLDRPDAPR